MMERTRAAIGVNQLYLLRWNYELILIIYS